MKKSMGFILVLLSVLMLTGCPFEVKGFKDQVLQGNINQYNFTFSSGYASESIADINDITVYMYRVGPSGGLDPWESGAYTDVYPYVYFTIAKDSGSRLYTISTFGSGTNGIMLCAPYASGSFVLFDDGELEITSLDSSGGTVTGRIWATTFDDSSELNGNFTVPIDPATAF